MRDVGPGDPELMTIKTIRAIKGVSGIGTSNWQSGVKETGTGRGEEETFAKECHGISDCV